MASDDIEYRTLTIERVREVLAEHWITSVVCDHEAKTDRPTCSCSRWRCEPQPNVGAAVNAWIDHVIEQAFHLPPQYELAPADVKIMLNQAPTPFSEYVAEAKTKLIGWANLKGHTTLGGCVNYISRQLPCSYEMALEIMAELEKTSFVTKADQRGYRRLIPPMGAA